MSEVKNSNSTNDSARQSKIEELKEKIKLERSKAKELLKKGGSTKNNLYELLLALSEVHRIENIDDVCDFMDEIDTKYGLEYEGDSDLSKLYTELKKENMSDNEKENKDLQEKQDERDDSSEFVNSDEEIFSNPDADLDEMIKAAEARLELYKGLLHNVENSNYEHQLLLDRIQKIQKRYDDMAKKEDRSKIQHPTIEDFEF